MKRIGETVTIDGKKYKVTRQSRRATDCTGCAFKGKVCTKAISSIGGCLASYRPDREEVVLVEYKGENKMKKTGKKYIKLGKAYIEDKVIKVKILDQSHICEEFGNYKSPVDWAANTFVASNGFSLISRGCPSTTDVDTKKVYVRGNIDDVDSDYRPLIFFSLEDYNKFVEAVKEYNEYFSKPQVKEMTMEEICKELGYEVKIKKQC